MDVGGPAYVLKKCSVLVESCSVGISSPSLVRYEMPPLFVAVVIAGG